MLRDRHSGCEDRKLLRDEILRPLQDIYDLSPAVVDDCLDSLEGGLHQGMQDVSVMLKAQRRHLGSPRF